MALGNKNYDETDQVTSWTEVILVYNAALKEIGTAGNSKMVMLPIEATNILGSIAGIGEIAKESLKKDGRKSSKDA